MIPVAISTAHTKSNGSGLSDDLAHTLESGGAQAIAFAQNSRNEVRLPGGDGKQIIDSIRGRLLVLPENTAVLPGHGPITTIGEEKRRNPFLR